MPPKIKVSLRSICEEVGTPYGEVVEVLRRIADRVKSSDVEVITNTVGTFYLSRHIATTKTLNEVVHQVPAKEVVALRGPRFPGEEVGRVGTLINFFGAGIGVDFVRVDEVEPFVFSQRMSNQFGFVWDLTITIRNGFEFPSSDGPFELEVMIEEVFTRDDGRGSAVNLNDGVVQQFEGVWNSGVITHVVNEEPKTFNFDYVRQPAPFVVGQSLLFFEVIAPRIIIEP